MSVVEYSDPDFGKWVKRMLAASSRTVQDLAMESGVVYSDLSRLVNSGINGRPIRPKPDKIEKIVTGMQSLGIPVEVSDGLREAGYVVGSNVDCPPPTVDGIILTPAERAIIEQIRAMASGTPPTPTPPPAAPVDDHRTASERAQGVPVSAAKERPDVQPRKGPHPADRGL